MKKSTPNQGGAKASLAIAIRYAMTRLTVGPTGKSTFPIMKYQLQANAIAPLLARTISLGVALDRVKDEWFAIQAWIFMNHLLDRFLTFWSKTCCQWFVWKF